MGWEQRGPYQYYIRKEQQHGRTVRRSYGRGAAAMAAATADATRRQAQETARAEQRHLAHLDRHLDEVIGLIEHLMQATLLVAGYHQHHRSEWRKRHDERTNP
jgi:hypothetical protein